MFNSFGMHNPGGWTLRTPPELGNWGWTSTDIWCAPLITALYAYLTGAQEFWLTPPGVSEKSVVGNMDEEHARAVCALVLATLFAGRAVRTHGQAWLRSRELLFRFVWTSINVFGQMIGLPREEKIQEKEQ